MSFLRILLIVSIFSFALLQEDDLQVNLYSIPLNSEFDSKYSLRLYNQEDMNQSINQDLFAEYNTACLVANKSDVRNETASFLDYDIGDAIQIFQIDSDECQTSDAFKYHDTFLTIIKSESPMAAYPEFPMIKDVADFILTGSTQYQIYQDSYSAQNSKNYVRLYANFEINGIYIFVRTHYYDEMNETLKNEVLILLDRVYEYYVRN